MGTGSIPSPVWGRRMVPSIPFQPGCFLTFVHPSSLSWKPEGNPLPISGVCFLSEGSPLCNSVLSCSVLWFIVALTSLNFQLCVLNLGRLLVLLGFLLCELQPKNFPGKTLLCWWTSLHLLSFSQGCLLSNTWKSLFYSFYFVCIFSCLSLEGKSGPCYSTLTGIGGLPEVILSSDKLYTFTYLGVATGRLPLICLAVPGRLHWIIHSFF